MASEGFPNDARLRRRGEFDRVFAQGARVHGDRLTLLGARRSGETRLGVPCGRRYSKRAVDRNRFRRLVREAFRRARAGLPSGLDLVVLPRCRPEGASLAVFAEELPKLVERLARKLPPPCSDPS